MPSGHSRNLRVGRWSEPGQIYLVTTATHQRRPGFHDHALRQEEDLRAVARYVVINPVRGGLVRSVRDYPLWDACWI